MSLPKISIVTPSFNQGDFLEETILSVLGQDYSNLEYIVIDGGSTDKSVEILKKYAKYLSYWVSEPDIGQSDAINKGWKLSSGDIFAYINSDDTYQPDSFNFVAYQYYDNPNWGMIYGDCGVIDQDGSCINYIHARPFSLRELLFKCYIPQPAAFMKETVIQKVGYLNPTYHMSMDYDLWFKIGLEFPIRAFAGKHLANMRIHSSAKSISSCLGFTKENSEVLSWVLKDQRLPFAASSVSARAFGRLYFRHAAMLLDQELYSEARNSLLLSFRLYPRLVFSLKKEWRWVMSLFFLGSEVTKELLFRYKKFRHYDV